MKICFVTVVLNDLIGIQNTVNSIDRYIEYVGYERMECYSHIIVDGQSTDGTLTYIASRLKATRRLFTLIHTSKDGGIYDAMNKGVALSDDADYVLFLNSGDEINTSLNIEEYCSQNSLLTKNKVAGIAFGAKVFFGKRFFIKIWPRDVDVDDCKMPSIHQAILYKREALLSHPFSLTYKICGDYENIDSMLNNGLKFLSAKFLLVNFYTGGLSSKSPVILFSESSLISSQNVRISRYKKRVIKIKLLFSVLIYQILYRLFS
jgi:glycosyltransferase involved in cell wall biosynthesis